MGASQSKKRRKEKRKRKRFSPINEITRSASCDVIRTMTTSSSLLSCPHCQHSLSWSESVGVSSKDSPYNHRCLHGQYEEMRVGGAGFESCPNCYSLSQLSGGQSISSRGISMSETYRQHSTMSLNRTFSPQASRTATNAPAGNLQFSQLVEKIERQKDNGVYLPGATSTSKTFTSSKQTVPTPLTSAAINTFPSSYPAYSHPSFSHQSTADNQAINKDRKISVLDDEESKVTRWVKRKQMAQQLRDLRRHLEDKESATLYAPLLSSGKGNNLCGDNDPLQFERSSEQSRGCTSEEPRDTLPSNSSSINANPVAVSPTRRSTRSKFSRMSNYRYLDNHPVLTKLQNEQNNRLESMERRMKEIRISAMQEAERRKFAEIFPAKNYDSETQRMLDEAKETLEKLKEEKRIKMLSRQGQQSSQGHHEQLMLSSQGEDNKDLREISPAQQDSGEIIPVCVVPQRGCKSLQTKYRQVSQNRDKLKEAETTNKPFWLKSDWPEINLNQPLTWLLLPFLLFPLILRMLLSLIINTSTTALNERARRSSSSSDNVDERSRRRSSDSHHPCVSRLGSKKLS